MENVGCGCSGCGTGRFVGFEAARSFDVLASIQLGLYRAGEAAESARKAVQLNEQYLAGNPGRKASHSLALSLSRLGMASRSVADLDASEAALRRALEIENKLLVDNPADLSSLAAAGNCQEDLAMVAYSGRYPSRGDLETGAAHWLEASKIYSRLSEADPNDVKTRTLFYRRPPA